MAGCSDEPTRPRASIDEPIAPLGIEWLNPLPAAGRLNAIEHIGGNVAVAVGDDGLVLIRESGEWSVLPTPTGTDIEEIVGRDGQNFVVTARERFVGDELEIHGYIDHRWTEISTRSRLRPFSFSGLSHDDLWIEAFQVGAEYVGHYDGTGWSETATTTEWLDDFWSPGENTVYGTTSRRILYYDGEDWATAYDDTARVSRVVDLDGTAEGIAIGIANFDSSSAIIRMEGASFSIDTVGLPRSLNRILSAGDSEIWMIGSEEGESGKVLVQVSGSSKSIDTLSAIPDGSSITRLADGTIVGFWRHGLFSLKDGVYTEESRGTRTDFRTVIRWKDGILMSSFGDSLVYFNTETREVSRIGAGLGIGRWAILDEDRMFAVTSRGVGWLDDLGWRPDRIPDFPYPNDAWASGPDDIWLVGDGGNIYHYNGSDWKSHSGAWRVDLFAVAGFGPREVYAVGESGSILRFDGQTWSSMASPTEFNLYDIAVTESGEAIAVGEEGTILSLRHGTWKPVVSGTSTRLRRVGTDDNGDRYALGTEILLQSHLGVWSSQPVPRGTRDLCAEGPGDLILVGDSGMILRLH